MNLADDMTCYISYGMELFLLLLLAKGSKLLNDLSVV